jgi:tetratricopeptide (TPR) repeat protein
LKFKRFDEAIDDYTVLIELDKILFELDNSINAFYYADNAFDYYERAEIYYAKGDYQKAIYDCTRAISITSDESNRQGPFSGVYKLRADAYEKIGRNDLAAADRKTAESLTQMPMVPRNAQVELIQSKQVELAPKLVGFDLRGLSLDWYCQQRYGATSIPIVKEGDAYSWRCKVRGTTQEENDFTMDLIDACKKQYGNDFGPMLSDAKDVRSWKCTDTFFFDYDRGTTPGERKWLRKDVNNWIEQLPDHSETCYRVIGEESLNGTKGTVVKRCDNSFEAFVPDVPRKGKWLMFRLNLTQSWNFLGVIK